MPDVPITAVAEQAPELPPSTAAIVDSYTGEIVLLPVVGVVLED